MKRVTSVIGTENKTKFTLLANGIAIDHTSILAAELRTTGGLTIADSEVDPTDWDFTNSDFLTVKLGLADAFPGVYTCWIIIKDSLHDIGLTWDGTKVQITFIPYLQ